MIFPVRVMKRTHLPGKTISLARFPLSIKACTSFLHCVDFPALSQPSKTIRAPRPAILSRDMSGALRNSLLLRAVGDLVTTNLNRRWNGRHINVIVHGLLQLQPGSHAKHGSVFNLDKTHTTCNCNSE